MGVLKGYTAWYEKTYDEWCHEKAQRVYKYLLWCFHHKQPVDLQHLAFTVYRERLNPAYFPTRKYRWKPHKNRFLDFKPSPFIKNFLGYLIEQLKGMGYIRDGYVVLTRDMARTIDALSYEYGRYLWGRRHMFRELRDEVGVCEGVAMARDRPREWVVEVIDSARVAERASREVRFGARIWLERRVVSVPGKDLLVELCTWKPDP